MHKLWPIALCVRVCVRKLMKIFWTQKFPTRILPDPNFFKPSVPDGVCITLAFASLFSSGETNLAALPAAEHVWPILLQTGGWWWWWWGGGAVHPPIPYLSRKVYCCRSRAAKPRFMLQLSQGRGITQGAGAVHMDAAACHQTHRHTSKKKISHQTHRHTSKKRICHQTH